MGKWYNADMSRTKAKILLGQALHVRLSKKARQTLTAFRRVIAKMASDRASYVSTFFVTLDNSADNVNKAADWAMDYRHLIVDPKAIERMTDPFSLPFLITFASLMDELDEPEQLRYRQVWDRTSQTWQKFFCALPVHHGNLGPQIAAAQKAVHTLLLEHGALFLGDRPPELTRRWLTAWQTLTGAIAAIQKELAP